MLEPIHLPENKSNELISRQTRKLLDSHAFQVGKLSGDAIMGFSSHQQINQFLKFQIHQDWNSQMARLRHPFFDFEHPEVKDAMKKVMNVLSRHISVSKQDFEPLLEKAVFNTLRLILNPTESMGKFFFPGTDRIPVELFMKHAHYFSDYDFVIQAIRKYYEKNNVRVIEKAQFFQLFEKVINIFESRENKSIREYQGYLFNKAFGLDLEAFLDEKGPAIEKPGSGDFAFNEKPSEYRQEINTSPAPDPVIQAEEPKQEEQPVTPAEEVMEPNVEEMPAFKAEEPMVDKAVVEETPSFRAAEPVIEEPVVETPQEPVFETPAAEPVQEQEVPETPPRKEPSFIPQMEEKVQEEAQEEEEEPVMELKQEEPVNEDPKPLDLFSKQSTTSTTVNVPEQQTLAQKLQSQSQPGNLADSFTQGHQKSLSKIPVHQQFQYIQHLFGGSSVKYKVVIEKLESCNTFAEADDILDKYVFNSPDVNRSSNVSIDFIEVIKKSF